MNQKGLIAVLGVVVIVLIGTTVYFATTNKSIQPVVPAPKVVQQPAQNPASATKQQPPPVSDVDVGWKTYTNTKYGFELKYPKDYIVSENGIQQANGPAYQFESILISALDEKVGFRLHINISSDPNILVGPSDREIKEEKVISGVKFAGFSDLGMGDRFGYTAKYGNSYYRLTAVFDTGLFDQILSTFKFIK